MKEIGKIIVKKSESIRSALQKMDNSAEGILLLTDDQGRLARTVTDGDIRRLLLDGKSLEETLGLLPAAVPITMSPGVSNEAVLETMNARGINHIPVIDDDGIPVSIFLRREVDQSIMLSTPHIGEHERSFVEDAFRTNWIAPTGPNVTAFEIEISEYVGTGYAAAVSSGTAALHLALRVLGVGAGDTVFVPSFTFIASANPILYQNAEPVFIDSEPETWNMSPVALKKAFQDARKTGRMPKAVIVVSLYGQSADMDELLAICNENSVPVVEDAAESLGATYKGKYSGTLGRIGIYSFNGNKIITTSGGGMLVSDSDELIDKARFLSTQAKEPAQWYEHEELGYNYRMSNVLAGIGRGQLKVLDKRIQSRQEIFERYRDGLSDISAIRWMPEASFGKSTRWLTAGLVKDTGNNITPGDIIGYLDQLGIEARYVWKPLHQQKLFQGSKYFTHGSEDSFSDYAFRRGFCLPSGSNMTENQQARIIDAMKKKLMSAS